MSKTILVVDDVPDNISVLAAILRDHYKIKPAPNGQVALKIAGSANPPDLILLDIMMPIMDGYEVIKNLKSNPETEKIPVIFVTAKSDNFEEEKGFELGAAGYLTKPVNPDEVLETVKKIFHD